MNYNLEDINIGDGIYFDSLSYQQNYNLYWKVTSKNGNMLHAEISAKGNIHYCSVNINKV